MRTADDYRRQLSILNGMLAESQQARARFDAARHQYADQIRRSRGLGYMGDYVDQLEGRYREFSDRMDQLLTLLTRGEVLIADQEQRVQRLMADAQSSS